MSVQLGSLSDATPMKHLEGRLRQLLKSGAQSITVDVFDTLLLREEWPEELQFARVAQRWSVLVEEQLGVQVSPTELLETRLYAREVLWRTIDSLPAKAEREREITAADWFGLTLDLTAWRRGRVLSEAERANLRDLLLRAELDEEIGHLRPNLQLTDLLRRLKSELGCRMHFLSDMYLTSRDVEELLGAHGIDFLDGGLTSGDIGVGKSSGRLFRQAVLHFADLEMRSNVHIGDSRSADYLAPIAEGSEALLLSESHHRRRRISAVRGRRAIAKRGSQQSLNVRESFLENFRERPVALRVGALFAAPLLAYVSEYVVRALHSPDTRFVAVSSEAKVMQKAASILFPDAVLAAADVRYEVGLNRRRALKALAAQIAEDEHNHHSAVRQILAYGENLHMPDQLLKFFGISAPSFLLSRMAEPVQSEYLWEKLRSATDLTDADNVAASLDLDVKKKTTLLDVGWGGSIQMFLREVASLRASSTEIDGLYIGAQLTPNRFNIERGNLAGLLIPDTSAPAGRALFVPEIWEYVLSDKPSLKSGRHALLQEGIQLGITYFLSQVESSPMEYWNALRPELERLLVRPTRREVELLGSIQIDSGFADERLIPLVDMRHAAWRVRLRSVAKRKQVARELVSLYCWTGGTIEYYGIRHMWAEMRKQNLFRF